MFKAKIINNWTTNEYPQVRWISFLRCLIEKILNKIFVEIKLITISYFLFLKWFSFLKINNWNKMKKRMILTKRKRWHIVSRSTLASVIQSANTCVFFDIFENILKKKLHIFCYCWFLEIDQLFMLSLIRCTLH